MNWKKLVIGAAVGTLVSELAWGLLEVHEVRVLFRKAQEASAASGKPLLVVGRPDMGFTGLYGCGEGDCLDISGCPTCENSIKANIENLSDIPDKKYGACFVSHVLEHVQHPEQALAELQRVADQVYIGYPRAWTLGAWIHPSHSQFMGQNGDGSWWFRAIPGRVANQDWHNMSGVV